MMRILTFFLLIGISFAFIPQPENELPKEAKTATITGLVKSLTAKEINIMEYGLPFNLDADNKVKIDERGNFSIELPLEKGQYFYVVYKRGAQLVYLSPGDDLNVTFDGRKINSTIEYEGSAKEMNDYLLERSKNDKISQNLPNQNGQKYGLYMLEWDAYKTAIDENKAVMQTALNQFKSGKKIKGDLERFVSLEQAHIDGTWAMFYMQYPAHHAHFTKSNQMDLWSNLDMEMIKNDVVRNNDQLLYSRAYRDFMNQYVMSLTERMLMEKKERLRSKSEFINRTYQNTDNVFTTQWERDYIKARLLYEQIDKHGITNMQKSVDDFNSLKLAVPAYKKAVQKVYDKWALTMPGAQAPEILGTDIDGNEVKLSDFRGKLVYIDVWATWCGPCRKEIPHLQKTEEMFHDKDVVFLSVSIDNDRKKWEKMVVDQSLGGVQIQMPGGWGSKICKEYNITGIPRFMLIDADGKVIDTKTMRPSQGISGLLQKHLQEG